MNVDILFDSLITGSTWAGILGGFVLVIAILFIGARAFNKSNMQLETYGFMVLTLIGTILATALGLFPTFILILFIVVSLVVILLKTMVK